MARENQGRKVSQDLCLQQDGYASMKISEEHIFAFLMRAVYDILKQSRVVIRVFTKLD